MENKTDADKPHKAALSSLEYFAGNYVPATKGTADVFLNTGEICNSIEQHTGYPLQKAEVYEMMINMGYSYHTNSDGEFNWLLKKYG